MYKIKSLEWNQQESGTIFSEPLGLRWMYYITPYDNEFELTLINEHGDTNDDLWVTCDSIEEAKAMAIKHYEETLARFLIKLDM